MAARIEVRHLVDLDVIKQLYDSKVAPQVLFVADRDERLRLLNEFGGILDFLN